MKIRSAEFVISNSDVKRCPSDQRPEYAFIGRSNVGKSSLINMLLDRKGLAKTSGTPGKTLLINHFLVNGEWWVVDLPGYGYAQRSKESRENLTRIIEDYVLEREQMTCLFVLVDSRLKPQQIDLEFMEWLGENDVPFAVVLTKMDKLKTNEAQKNVSQYKKAILTIFEELPPMFMTSSENKRGREELLNYISEINASLAGV